MLAKVNSCAVFGMDAHMVKVEVDVSPGLPCFDIVGLPDASVRESKERVRTAIKNSGFEFPLRRITVNLAPADIKKEGSNFDLPIAMAILAATGQIEIPNRFLDALIVGELSLDGTVRPVNGVLAMAMAAEHNEAISTFILPEANSMEGALTGKLTVYGITDLLILADWLKGNVQISPAEADGQQILAKAQAPPVNDMADVKGQEGAKRAMEIAAAGGHNMIMIGSPGSGKTMLARRLPSIMPELTLNESLAVTRIYSIAGELPLGRPLITERPFRAPHHTASGASIIGGGRIPIPGEVSLAHHGVLFMDELPEFQRDVLEALRQPLEDKTVTVARVQGRSQFSAAFQLIAAMNPCPCGYFGDPLKPCKCTPFQIQRYMNRISGPLLDRIDLHVDVQRVRYEDISKTAKGESSAQIKARVMSARNIQQVRFQGTALICNADMERKHVQEWCKMQFDAEILLAEAFKRLNLSARAHDRLLKVARTIADLAGENMIGASHIAEAVQYRSLDRLVRA